MSWGVNIHIDHSDGYSTVVDVVSDHTYNLTPMWAKALPTLLPSGSTRDLDGRACGEISHALVLGLVDAVLHKSEYEELGPENGWGDYEGFVSILSRLTTLCYQHPTGELRWNG